MGKPMDKELISAVVLNHVRNGLLIKQACHAAGVGERTFRTWRKQDRPLSAALKKAGAEFERAHVQNIVNHGVKDWKASAWILERKFPERYARRVANVEPQNVSADALVKVPKPTISVAELQEAVAILEKIGFMADD